MIEGLDPETSRVKAYLQDLAGPQDSPPPLALVRPSGAPSIVSKMRQAVSGDG